jgi:hypothetical protein
VLGAGDTGDTGVRGEHPGGAAAPVGAEAERKGADVLVS